MIDAIIKILEIIGLCGLLIFGLMIVNISSGCLINIKEKGESFSKEKFIKGILKTVVLYIATCILAIIFTLLPFLNELINNIYNIQLISIESLQTLSNTSILTLFISVIINQSMKAFSNIKNIWTISNDNKEEITWEVKDE